VPDFLVTGTDTGIGKTVVAAAFVKALRARGVRAVGFKPAETGCEQGQIADSELLARASGERPSLAAPLLRLDEPLAPAVAAERARVEIDPLEIEQRIEALRRAGFTVVVEGAGGVLVPLSWNIAAGSHNSPFYSVMDLADHCGLHAIVVARPGLGTLNHTATTVAMLHGRNIPIRAVVLNGRTIGTDAEGEHDLSSGLAEATNPSVLARMLPGMLIVEVPRHAGPDVVDATVPYLEPLLAIS